MEISGEEDFRKRGERAGCFVRKPGQPTPKGYTKNSVSNSIALVLRGEHRSLAEILEITSG